MEPRWLALWFGGLALAHLAVLLRGTGRGADDSATDARRSPECGTLNEPESRYCRSCVSGPGSTAAGGTADRPDRRRVP